KTVHRTVFKGYCAAYCNKEGRSCSPLLETLSRFSPPAPFRGICACGRGEGSFALCGARPKGSALWTSASWAQLDQLMSAASPPKNPHDSALNQNLSAVRLT
ncbi:MAG: hypothetical protein HDT21_00400, partial [Ruminococcus sp.]|nr:hypothetical protein [Ruminococcus sp.]